MALATQTDDELGIEPYRLHVSQRWLDLTKRKLELARTPKLPSGTNDAPPAKTELISLLDHWTETYDHRVQEEVYNTRLPQYRTNLSIADPTNPSIDLAVSNIHFVHRKSSFDDAIPLLFCHDWGGSFIETARVVESLCEPISTPTPDRTSEKAFHVVCPSIPGFGFSDASSDPNFGLEGTANILDALMKKLGYSRYILHGSRWGYLVCRTIALRHPDSCIALHTAGLEAPPPTFQREPIAWIAHHLARLTKAQYPILSFGYVPSDFDSNQLDSRKGGREYRSPLDALALRVHALDYALADSPTGLLALILSLIRSQGPYSGSSIQDPWNASEIIMWTMIYWLPGPEAPLRWLRNAAQESSYTSPLWRKYSPVPLGVSHFRGNLPPAWACGHQRLSWVRRHGREIGRPAWEAPEDLVVDLRAFAEDVCLEDSYNLDVQS